MSVLENSDTVAEAIRPTLEQFVAKAEPHCRKVSEEIYEQLLYSVQDYLRDNAEWNIGAEIDRCRRIEHDNTQLRGLTTDLVKALTGLTGIMNTAESNASGNPEWEVVRDRINFARHTLARAKGTQP